jgi:hypothetical protein
VNSLVAEPLLTAYCASKGGVLMLTKAVALDYADIASDESAFMTGSAFVIDGAMTAR